jgi:hypothetical protein
VAEVGLETKLGWEFRKSVSRIHFNAVISTAASVRRLKSTMVGWAVEGHKLVYAIADTLEGTT